MLQLGFYELLGCDAGAQPRTILRRFNALARIYHPDKGGSTVTYRYVHMVTEVLKNPATRAEYDANGKARWAKVFASEAGTEKTAEEAKKAEEEPNGPQRVPAPRLNVDFLRHLLEQRGTYECKIGNLTLDCYLHAALARLVQPEDCYYESSVAKRLGLHLRLVGTKGGLHSMPVYPMPRLVRYAAFMGMDLVELDMPASMGAAGAQVRSRPRSAEGVLGGGFRIDNCHRSIPRLPRNRGRQRSGEHAHRRSRCGQDYDQRRHLKAAGEATKTSS